MLLYKKVKIEWDRSLSTQKSRELRLLRNGKNKKATMKNTTAVSVSKSAVADMADSDFD